MKVQPTRTSAPALDTGRAHAGDKGAAVLGRRAGGAPTAAGALLHRFADVGMVAPQPAPLGAPAPIGRLSAAPAPCIQRDRENTGSAVPPADEIDIADYALGPLDAVAPDATTGPGVAGPAIAAEAESEEGVLGEEETIDPDYDASADEEEDEEEVPALSLASALLNNYGVSQPQPQFQDFFASLLASQGPVISLPSLPAPSPYSFSPPSSFGLPSSFELPSSSATVEPEEEAPARAKRKTTDTGGEALYAQAHRGTRSSSRRSLRIKRLRPGSTD